MKNKPGIVFIHGAGLNASIWDKLKGEIDTPVLKIDFPNRMTKNHGNDKLTFQDYVNTTADEIKNWNRGHFIIVAHSIGACVGLKVAQQFKDELKGFIAIGSVIPGSGQSFASSFPFPQKFVLPVLLSLFGTKPPKKAIETELCNDLSAEATLNIINQFTPEAKALYTTKINYTLPDTERCYVKLLNDKSIPIGLQDQMAKNFKATRIETITSGHLPMLSKPDELANILTGFIGSLKS